MSAVFRDADAGWVAALIVVLPLVIIGIGEVEERLRQNDSSLRRSIAILRTWVVPLFAVWALLEVLVDPDPESPAMRLVESLLILTLSASALAALGVLIGRLRDRPRAAGRRTLPRLVLAVPRLLVVLVTAWLLIAGVWAVDLSAALTALGVTSLVISFALQDTLGGLASGFTLLADQPFQPGDWIRSDGVEGRVLDINWRSSRIETRDGDLVVVPNGQLAKATITNFDEPTRLHRVVVSLQVAFRNPPTAAKEMLLAAARATPNVLAEPAPAARVAQIDDPLMGYEVHMWVDDYAVVPQVRSDFGSLVWYHARRLDVPLPSPAQDLYLWDGYRVAADAQRDHASLASGLRSSALLDQLAEDELDRLAGAATAAAFATGETIVDRVGADRGDVLVVERGRARLEIRRPGEDAVPVIDFAPGDLIGIVEADSEPELGLAVVAVSDCEVITLRAGVASDVISRSPALATALEQVATSRRRRLQRVERRLAREAELEASRGVAETAADAREQQS